jgi:Zinc finger, ZZ type
MSFFVTQGETTMKATGKNVSVPNRDVNKLSYYLRCGTVSCGVDIIVDELLDFQNVHKLAVERQDAIFKLAFDTFDLETLANKTIFLDDDNTILPANTNNEFYELQRCQTFMTVQESVLIAGQQKQLHKIMICNKAWLTKFYLEPLQRNDSRIRRIMAAEEKPKTKSLTAEDLLAAALIQLIIGNDEEKSTKNQHCDHCTGQDGVCDCIHGCPATAESQCQVVHKTITCDLCFTIGIKGARYQCQECYNFDVCERCYERGDHAGGTHAFSRLARVGSNPVYIQPKKVLPPPIPISSPVTPVRRTNPQTPVTPEKVADDPDIAVPFAEAVASPTFRAGQAVRLRGLVQKPERNGCSVVVVHDMGSRVVVTCEDGTKITVKASNLETVKEISIPVGTVVEIHGIVMDETLNGSLGVVVDVPTGASPNRVKVQLLDNDSRILSLKPENVRELEDEF